MLQLIMELSERLQLNFQVPFLPISNYFEKTILTLNMHIFYVEDYKIFSDNFGIIINI